MAVANLSEHVREAVEHEREVIAGRLADLRTQAERLHAVVAVVDRSVEETVRLLRQIDEMLGLAPQLSLEAMHGELRGQRLREIAIDLLRQKKGVGSIVHYREWYELVLEEGLRVAGKDPLATFLTQIARAPAVESVRPRSGLYRLRAA
ncbi:MAG TPA: hypothetical protein VK488_12805 [Gaiellaceae bacterium]|nr:hypothetical protein [Gaiellaceae bacterium]